MPRSNTLRWLLVQTRTTDGHVFNVYRYPSRSDAIRDGIEDYTGTEYFDKAKKALEDYGTFVDADTRITVCETRGE